MSIRTHSTENLYCGGENIYPKRNRTGKLRFYWDGNIRSLEILKVNFLLKISDRIKLVSKIIFGETDNLLGIQISVTPSSLAACGDNLSHTADTDDNRPGRRME